VLAENDFEGHTLLMHATSSAPAFRVVHQAMVSAFGKDVSSPALPARSWVMPGETPLCEI